MPFPSFCSGSVAKYEGKFCEGAGKDTVFVFHPTITLLPSVYGIKKYLRKDTTLMRKRFQLSRLNDTDFSCTDTGPYGRMCVFGHYPKAEPSWELSSTVKPLKVAS